jgi:hypothetical protein
MAFSHPKPTAQWGVLPQNGHYVQPRLYVGLPESADICRMLSYPHPQDIALVEFRAATEGAVHHASQFAGEVSDEGELV